MYISVDMLESTTGGGRGFESGDYVKFEIKDDKTGAAEWMWLRVDSVDESRKDVHGWLDSRSVVFATTVKTRPAFGNQLRQYSRAQKKQ
jgi:hypothetical protein